MKVHLIRAAEMAREQFEQVHQVLQSQPGPLSFIAWREGRAVNPEHRFQELAKAWIANGGDNLAFMEDFLGLASWEELFQVCTDFRREHRLPEEDFVIYLTPQPNLENWFSAFEENTNNIFIHTDDWEEEYLHCSPIFPVSYLVMSQILQKSLYGNVDVNVAHAHQQPVGCINDFCGNKRQIIFKLRTADICPICMKFIVQTAVRPELVNQVLAVFEVVRKEMLFRQRFDLDLVPGRLHINDINQILLPDYGKEIELSPLQKCIYFFFLKHPKGIFLNDRGDYQEELLMLYRQLDTRVGKEYVEQTFTRQRNTISKLTDLRDNSMNEHLSKINRKIKDALGEEQAKPYLIPKAKGELKQIPLDRSLLSCDSGII